jgi:hypothetical protein
LEEQFEDFTSTELQATAGRSANSQSWRADIPRKKKMHQKKTSTSNISQFVITAGLSTEEQGSYERVLLYAMHSV